MDFLPPTALAITAFPAWDESLFRAVNLAGTSTVLDVLMLLFTSIALPYVLGLLVIPLWWRGHKELAFDLLIMLVIVILVTEVLKFAVDRARPCDVLQNVRMLSPGACAAESDPAFPSGHASRIFAVAMLLSLYFRWPVKLSAFLIAAAAGLSRVYLGLHWPSDVFDGAGLGIGLAAALVVMTRKWGGYQKARSRVVGTISRTISRKPGADANTDSDSPHP